MSDEQKEIEKQERRERYLKSKAAKTTPPRSNLSDKSPAKSTKYNALSKIKKLLPSNDKTTTYVLKQLVKVSTPSKKKKSFWRFSQIFLSLNLKVGFQNVWQRQYCKKKTDIDFFDKNSVDLSGKDKFSKRLKKQKKVLVEPIQCNTL